MGIHCDAPDAVGIEVQAKKTAIKKRAAETVETPLQIITKVHSTSSLAAQGTMECNKSLVKIVQRTRTRLGIANLEYQTLASINIPEEYRRYENTPGNFENFLLGDSGSDDEHRILVFGRSSLRSWIEHATRVYVDGTFSVAPKLFAQFFVILAERTGCVIPICYVPIPNKTADSYCEVCKTRN